MYKAFSLVSLFVGTISAQAAATTPVTTSFNPDQRPQNSTMGPE
jgi:hypothetical protein